MITSITAFELTEPVNHDELAQRFKKSALKYAEVPGLIQKYFCVSEDGKFGADIYLWESKAAEDNLYTEEWMERQVINFGTRPTITWMDCLTIVDRKHTEIIHCQDD